MWWIVQVMTTVVVPPGPLALTVVCCGVPAVQLRLTG